MTIPAVLRNTYDAALANRMAALNEQLRRDIERSSVLIAALFPEDDELQRDMYETSGLVWC